MTMSPPQRTSDLRALLKAHVPLEPEHELHAQSLALLAEIEAALDEADEKDKQNKRDSVFSVSECISTKESQR